jgi:hypothetical protein
MWRISDGESSLDNHPAPSRDIPFDRLVLSQSTLRHIKVGVSVVKLPETPAAACVRA